MFTVLALTGCSGLRLPVNGDPIHDTARRDACWQRIQGRYPGVYRLVQRIALRAMGKQYDMIGYLVMRPDGDFRAVAMGEMGGRVFDLAVEHDEPKIKKKPDKMPPRPLLDGVIGDLCHLLIAPQAGEGTLYPATDGAGVKLAVTQNNGKILEAIFAGERSEIRSTLERGKWRIERRAEFSDYKTFDGFRQAIPTRIKLTNHRWHYSMEIQTLELHLGAAAAPLSKDGKDNKDTQ
jgi:hypothetical protein